MPTPTRLDKLSELLDLWNYALSAMPTNLFSLTAPYIYLEVGRTTLERLRARVAELEEQPPR